MLLCEAAYIESWISPIISDWLLYISGHRSLYNIRCKQVTAFQKQLTWLKISLLVKKKNEILSLKVNFKIFLRPLKYLILLYIIFNTNDHPPLKRVSLKTSISWSKTLNVFQCGLNTSNDTNGGPKTRAIICNYFNMQCWHLNIIEKFSSGTKDPKQTNNAYNICMLFSTLN